VGSQGSSSYSTNIFQALASPSSQIETLPGLVLAQIFSLPLYSVEFFFFLLFHLASGVFMYFFFYRYSNMVLGTERTTGRIAISLAGGLIFMYFPYNILGDNFPELFFMRSFTPLFLLLFMEFMESRKVVLFALSTVLLGYMTILDPRALIFIPTLAFFFLVLPKICLSRGALSKIAIFASFVLSVIASFVISYFTVTPRITAMPVPTTVGVPFVKEVFRYSFSNMLNTLNGLSFEGTLQASTFLPFNFANYLPIIGLFVALVAFSVFFTIKFKQRRLAMYVFIPALFAFAVLAAFVNFGGSPLFQNLLFSGPSASLPSSVKTVALLFRTPRFTNITLALIYSIFSCLSISFFIKFLKIKSKAVRFFAQNEYQIIIIDRKVFFRKSISLVLIALFMVSVVSSVVIFTASGSILGDYTGERANAFWEVNRLYGNNIGSSILTVPYSGTLWDFPQAPVGLSESVMRYIYAYALDPYLSTSLLSRNQTCQIGSLLSMAGIKYLVVDGYTGNQERVIDIMNHSSSLIYSGQVGQLFIFRVSNFGNITLGDPIIVNSGLETYFRTLGSLRLLSINSSFTPIFMDGPLSWKTNDFPSFGAILSSPNKSKLDLIGPFMVNDQQALVLPLSQYTSNYNPSNYWSPAFVSDTHQGVWTNYLGQKTGYDWDYSYSPSYGFAFTWGPDTICLNFEINQTANYSVFVRSLHHPENGSVKIWLDSNQTLLNTSWNSSSTEFVWDSLGEVNLTKGSHSLSFTNEEGLNAVNLVVIIPSENVRQLDFVAEQFYNYAGDVKIPNMVSISNSSTFENYSMNVFTQGNYSALIRLTVERPADNSVQLVFNNQTYPTQTISLDPYVVYAGDVALSAGNQSIELISSQRFNASNISMIVYGPNGSMADKIFSGDYSKSQVDAGNLSINQVSASYYETSISFNTNSSFMLVLPQLYTGTMKVTLGSQPYNISYSTYPVFDVFTGIFFKLPNETSNISFTATFYTDEGRAFRQSNDNTLFLVGTMILVAVTLDIVLFLKHKKNKQLVKPNRN
jgi:hypothetical protein